MMRKALQEVGGTGQDEDNAAVEFSRLAAFE